MKTEYIVEGMTCNHCKAAVEKAVSQISGVENVEAFPSENKVLISGNASKADIQRAVESLGYNFKGELIS